MRPSTFMPFGALFAICGAAALAQALPATQDSSPAPSAPQAQLAPSGQALPTVDAARESPAPSEEERQFGAIHVRAAGAAGSSERLHRRAAAGSKDFACGSRGNWN